MLFNYKTIDQQGNTQEGSIDAVNVEVAISGLQRRGLTISTITPADQPKNIFDKNFKILEINDTPGLDHYATTGPAQRKIVEDLYLKVLKHMEK